MGMNSIDPAMDLSSLPVVPVFVMMAALCLIIVVVYGFSMKWSLSLAGCGEHSFAWSFFVSIAAGMASGVVSVVCVFAADSIPPYLPFILMLIASILTVSVMTQSGPISASVAYFAFMVIGGFGMVLSVVVLAVVSTSFIDMDEFAKMAQSMDPEMLQNTETTSGEEDMWANMPSQFDNAFFESEEAVSEVSASSQASLDKDESGSPEPYHSERIDSGSHDPHTPRKSNPNSVQVNPFVQ
ncbi:hypothetical protein [Rhodopirellula europaea]|uniref:Signal peptide protein n=1 Tax=Rhodopirellula europaea 6C TaxID=1263867 RepID=M2AXA6_9BACT|nr:hypothetical protein [Rhodopirellula europaea]EMB14198.1 signal peptide protein [Rhodopirellula europaea 6C]